MDFSVIHLKNSSPASQYFASLPPPASENSKISFQSSVQGGKDTIKMSKNHIFYTQSLKPWIKIFLILYIVTFLNKSIDPQPHAKFQKKVMSGFRDI